MKRWRTAWARWRGMAGLACLAAYLLGVGWLAPFATALIAASDAEHRVLLSVSVRGASIVLAHDVTRPGMQPGHEHHPVAALLVAMASEAPGGMDHVLSFPSGLELGGSGLRWERPGPVSKGIGVVGMSEVSSWLPNRASRTGGMALRMPTSPSSVAWMGTVVLRC